MNRLFLPAAVLLTAFVVACSGTGATTAPATQALTSIVPSAPATPAPTLAFTVSLAPAGFFVGSNGMTLYTFDKDVPGTSNCQVDPCLTNWPALTLASGASLAIGAGLNESDFGSIARNDGSKQVTFKDIPLYFFSGDTAIGETKGDGVGGIWHLATKASTLPLASAEPSPSAPASIPASAPASAPATSGGGDEGPCYDAHYQVIPCPSSAAGSPAASGSPAALGPTVSVSAEGYLVGPTEFSLYTFDHDTTPGTSACGTAGDCATNWPALTIESGEDVTLGEGLDEEDFTTFTREDGTTQVSYYDKPLYMYAADTAPGDTTGDGAFDLWHLAMPQ